MPQVGAFLTTVSKIVTFGKVAGGTAALIIGATTIVGASFAASRLLRPKIDMDIGDGDGSRQRTVRSTIEPQKLVYGETMVSGPLTYAQVSGTNNKYLHQVIALAGHELTQIKEIHFDDKSIDITDSNIYNASNRSVISGFFGPKNDEGGNSETVVLIDTRLGTSSQTAYADLRSDSKTSQEYLATHRGDGIASLYTRWTLNEGSREVWDEVGSVQNIKAVVKGKKVYDPRLDVNAGNTAGTNPTNASYVVYSDNSLSTGSAVGNYDRSNQGQNPALILADYLMDSRFGLGIASSKIDWSSVVAAADHCDQLVPVPSSATQKRFFGSGVIFGGDKHRRSIEKILNAMNGSLVYTSGKYVIRAGVYFAVSETLTESDVIGPVQVRTSIPRSDRFNQVKGLFIDPSENYKMMEFGPVTTGANDFNSQPVGAIARDNGEVLTQEIRLPFTSNRYAAQRLALLQVAQSYHQTVITVPVNLKGMRIAIGDRVNLTIDALNEVDSGSWSPKIFKCIGWSFSESDQGGIDLTLIEDFSASYNNPQESDYSTISAEGVITTSLPDVPSPTNFTATAGINRVELNWTNPPNTGAWEQIWVYASTSSTTPTDSSTPIAKFRGTSFTHMLDGGTNNYYWIQAVRYPNGTTPGSGQTNAAKSAFIPSSPTNVTANKITTAVIGDGQVDTTQIANDAIDSDKIDTIQSSNYSDSAGSEAGWKIDQDGSAEFNNVVVRGNVNATTGTIGGLTVGSDKLYVGTGTFNNSNTAFYVDDQGQLSLKDKLTWNGSALSVSGTVNASAGAFTGDVSTSSKFIAGSGATSATMDGNDPNFKFYAGAAAPGDSPFKVDAGGVVTADRIVITRPDDSSAVIFDSAQDGLVGVGLAALSADSDNAVVQVADELTSNTDYARLILSASSQTLTIKVLFPLGYAPFAISSAEDFPDSITIKLQQAAVTDGTPGTFVDVSGGTKTFTRRAYNASDASDDDFYSVNTSGTGWYIKGKDGIDDQFNLVMTDSSVYTVGDKAIRAQVSFVAGSGGTSANPSSSSKRTLFFNSATQYFTIDSSNIIRDQAPGSLLTGDVILSAASGARTISWRDTDNQNENWSIEGLTGYQESGSGILHFKFDNGSSTPISFVSNGNILITGDFYTGAGAIAAGTASIGGGYGSTGLSIADNGNLSTDGDVIIGGDLTVSGTTTSVNSTELQVTDRNITVNYSTGDSSSTADGAGITIQDAVDASTDATLLWRTSSDTFDFSHAITVPGIISTGTTENRFSALTIGADSDLYFYESATNEFTIRTGTTGSFKYFTFNDDGSFNVLNGGITAAGAVSATGSANPTSTAHAAAIVTSGSYGGGFATRDTAESGWYQQTNGADWHFYHNRNVSSDTPESKKVLSFNSGGAATFANTTQATRLGANVAPNSNYGVNALQNGSMTHAGFFQANGDDFGIEVNATASGSYSSSVLYVRQSSRNTGGNLARFANSDGDKFTLTTAGAATFAGKASIATSLSDGNLTVHANSDSLPGLSIMSDSNHGMHILHRATEGNFSFLREVGGTKAEFLNIARATGDATFAGSVTGAGIIGDPYLQAKGADGAMAVFVDSKSSFDGSNTLNAPFVIWREADGSNIAGIRGYVDTGGNKLALGTGFFDQEVTITPNGMSVAGTISSGTHQLNDGQLNVHSSGVSAVIGSIGNTANDINIFSTSSGHNGLRMHVDGILPTDNTGTIIDADADLGHPNYRFKNLWLSGTINSGTITASGGNSDNNDDANILTLNASQHARLLVDTSSTSGHRATLALESNGNETTLSTTGSASFLNVDTGDLTLDVAGSIVLDADSTGVVDFKDGGTHFGRIENASSDFKLESRVQDKDIVLVGNDGGIGIEALRLDMSNGGQAIFSKGASFADHVYLGDDDHLVLGGGDDLRIYHDGLNSYIKDAGTGDLYIQGEANVRITDGDGNKMFLGQNDGEVQLYHNGFEKFHTQSTGVNVIGTVTADGLTVDKTGGNIAASFINSDSGNSYIQFQNSTTGTTTYSDGSLVGIDTDESLTIWQLESNHIKFGTSGVERLRISSSGLVDIGSNGSASAGASKQLLSLVNPNGTAGTAARLWMSGTNATTRGAFIEAEAQSTANDHDLIFATSASSATPSERLRISSSGLFATNSSSNLVIGNSASGNIYLGGGNTNTSNIFFQTGSSVALTLDSSNNASFAGNVTATGTVTAPTLISGAYGAGGTAGDGFRINSTDIYGQKDSVDKVHLSATNGNAYFAGSVTVLGNTGVGIASPDSKLHVHAASAGSVTALSGTTLTVESNANNYLSLLSPDANLSAIVYGSPSSTNNASINSSYNGGSPYLNFNTGGSQRMRIDNAGNVSLFEDTGTNAKLYWAASAQRLGINTTSPSTSLTVSGFFNATTAGSKPSITGTGFYGGGIGFIDTNVSGIYTDTAGANLRFFTNQSSTDTAASRVVMTLTGSGNLGLGTASPFELVELDKSSGNTFVRFDKAGTFKGLVGITDSAGSGSSDSLAGDNILRSETRVLLDTGGTTRLVVDASGKVAIGTTANLNDQLTVGNSTDAFTAKVSGAVTTIRLGGHDSSAAAGRFDYDRSTGALTYKEGTYDSEGAALFQVTGGGHVITGGTLSISTTSAGNGLGAFLNQGTGANFYEASDGTKTMIAGTDGTQDFVKIGSLSSHPVGLVTGNAEAVRIDTSQNVNFSGRITARDNTYQGGIILSPASGSAYITADRATASTGQVGFGYYTTGGMRWVNYLPNSSDTLTWYSAVAASNVMTLSTSGTLFVNEETRIGQNTGTIFNQTSVSGINASGGGYFQMAAADATVMYVNRIGSSSQGQVVGIYEAGAAVGGISSFGDTIQFGQGNVYLKMSNAVDAITPANGSGTDANGTLNLGATGARFGTFFLGGEVKFVSTSYEDRSLGIDATGFYLYNNSDSRYDIQVDTSGNSTFYGNVTAFSDARLKSDVETLDGSKVLEMRGVSYTRDGKAGSGVIAQELEQVASELVHTADDDMGTKSVAYANLTGYLIEAVKMQAKQIAKLEEAIKELKDGSNEEQ